MTQHHEIQPEEIADRLKAIERCESRITLKDVLGIGSLLLVLGSGIIALYTKVERVDARLEAHLTSRETHPTQDERRKVVQEEIDRGLRPVLTQLEEIKKQLESMQRNDAALSRRVAGGK